MMNDVKTSNLVYRYRKSNHLSDLNHDVFKRLAALIPESFLSQCASSSYGTYAKQSLARQKTKEKKINMEEALHRLSNEEWTVERLASELIRVKNFLALQEIVRFWPANFAVEPPQEITVSPDGQLNVKVEVNGLPAPKLEWFGPSGRQIGYNVPNLVLDFHGLDSGVYIVRASNKLGCPRRRVRYTHSEDRQFFVNTAIARTPVYAEDEAGVRQPRRGLMTARPARTSSPPGPPKATEAAVAAVRDCERTATRKVALIVGMSNYKEHPRLEAAYYDLPDLAEELTRLGFRVLILHDLPLADLIYAIKIYAQLLDDGSYGFLYLSGHGMRFKGKNDDFLVPVDAPAHNDPGHLLSRVQVVQLIQSQRPAMNCVVWDACRDEKDCFESFRDNQANPPEKNLFLFYPCIASMQAYEVKVGEKHVMKKRSTVVVKMLEIFKENKQLGVPEFLFELLRRMAKVKLQFKCGEMQPNPAIQMGYFNVSFWDPVEPAVPIVYPMNPVLSIWDEESVKIDCMFPMPMILPGPGLQREQVSLRFHMHNVLQLFLDRRKQPAEVAFDATLLYEGMRQCGNDPNVFDFDHLVAEDQRGHQYYRKLTIHHLQTLNQTRHERLNYDFDSFSLTFPVVLLTKRQCSHVTLSNLHLLRLFAAVRDA